jgi:hypothetical protein
MKEDVLSLVQEFGSRKKILFVHIRGVTGTPTHFRETFHDNGPTNMFPMIKAYKDIGFDGPLRSDDVPTMAGETNEHAGYEMKGSFVWYTVSKDCWMPFLQLKLTNKEVPLLKSQRFLVSLFIVDVHHQELFALLSLHPL